MSDIQQQLQDLLDQRIAATDVSERRRLEREMQKLMALHWGDGSSVEDMPHDWKLAQSGESDE